VSEKSSIRFGLDTCLSYHSMILDIFALQKWYNHPTVTPYPPLNFTKDFWLDHHRYEFSLCRDGTYSIKADDQFVATTSSSFKKL
jgi:hypothetical protein